MCLGVPGEVIEVREREGLPFATVDFSGVQREVCTMHVPEVQPGEWVLVHVGFALSRLDTAEAERVLALLEEIGEIEAERGE